MKWRLLKAPAFRINEVMKSFLLALQFLTRVPVTIKGDVSEKDLNRSLAYFPLVGGIIGLVISSAVFLVDYFPLRLIAVFILVVETIITGGLHLDGFADTCDGLYGGRTKERALEIMRDSRVGAMGVIGLILLLLTKYEMICSLHPNVIWKSVVLMPVISRFIQVLVCYSYKYARPEGKGKGFIGYKGKIELIIAAAFTLVILIILFGVIGLAVLAAVILGVVFFTSSVNKKLDGMTGDTIGASSELAEVFCLLAVLVITKFWN